MFSHACPTAALLGESVVVTPVTVTVAAAAAAAVGCLCQPIDHVLATLPLFPALIDLKGTTPRGGAELRGLSPLLKFR